MQRLGYARLDTDSGVKECNTFTCSHCQRIVHVRPKCPPADLGGHCTLCNRLICKHCVGKACIPWRMRMDRALP